MTKAVCVRKLYYPRTCYIILTLINRGIFPETTASPFTSQGLSYNPSLIQQSSIQTSDSKIPISMEIHKINMLLKYWCHRKYSNKTELYSYLSILKNDPTHSSTEGMSDVWAGVLRSALRVLYWRMLYWGRGVGRCVGDCRRTEPWGVGLRDALYWDGCTSCMAMYNWVEGCTLLKLLHIKA